MCKSNIFIPELADLEISVKEHSLQPWPLAVLIQLAMADGSI